LLQQNSHRPPPCIPPPAKHSISSSTRTAFQRLVSLVIFSIFSLLPRSSRAQPGGPDECLALQECSPASRPRFLPDAAPDAASTAGASPRPPRPPRCQGMRGPGPRHARSLSPLRWLLTLRYTTHTHTHTHAHIHINTLTRTSTISLSHTHTHTNTLFYFYRYSIRPIHFPFIILLFSFLCVFVSTLWHKNLLQDE